MNLLYYLKYIYNTYFGESEKILNKLESGRQNYYDKENVLPQPRLKRSFATDPINLNETT